MWAALERRRVVHAVAGDGDDLLLVLQRFDDAQLLIGADPREEDFGVIQRQLQLGVRRAPQLIAGDDGRSVRSHQADLARDRHARCADDRRSP